MRFVADILSEKINKDDLHDWILYQAKNKNYNFYSSIDIRYSGYKIAPVDVNIFPAGFNNLSQKSIELAALIIAKSYQNKKFLIFPEQHNRNLYYNDSLLVLKKILELSKNEAIIAHNHKLISSNGSVIPTSTLEKKNNILKTDRGYIPDIILLNNDMISGLPEILLDIEQELIPSPKLGWFKRLKSNYFNIYNEIVEKFCSDFSIDWWLINTFTNACTGTNFHKKEGLECIALKVEKMLKKIQDKYNEYHIQEKPYVFIKANNGSYGMGITTVFNADEIFNLNKNVRKKMNVTKGRSVIDKVLLQEGVATINMYKGHSAELMVYCIMNQSIAFLYRYHEQLSNLNNLNRMGAKFKELVIRSEFNDKFNLTVSLMINLALLATSIELEYYDKN